MEDYSRKKPCSHDSAFSSISNVDVMPAEEVSKEETPPLSLYISTKERFSKFAMERNLSPHFQLP